MRRALVPVLALSLLLALPSTPVAQAKKVAFVPSAIKQSTFRQSAGVITAAQLKDYLTFIASDDMEGRNTPSRGLDTTAHFIATMLSRWGVKPAGDEGAFLQRITLKKEKLSAEAPEVAVGEQKFEHGKDYLVVAVGGSANAPLVFAGDGWFVKGKMDAYEGLDPKGKIVVMTQGGPPKGIAMQELMAMKRGEAWIDPMAYAQKKGAIGVVAITPLMTQVNSEAMARMRQQVEGGTLQPEKFPSQGGSLPAILANATLVQAIFAKEKVDAATILMSFPSGTPVKPFALSSDKKLRFSIKTTFETVPTQNVVGVIEGSDPALRTEYVALGAHYDHTGTRPGATGDTIFNGADDDGTGTVALLAMAEALSKAPRHPKRSLVFVWHAGEEKGLWGSRYFTMFPTVPIDKIVAQLNIDMIGRSRPPGDTDPRNKDLSGPNEVYVIGSKMMSTELGDLSEAVNNAYLKLAYNYKYDDPKDPQKFFYRSDHIHYALKNIPIIFYFTGVHADYHQLSDEVSKIDFPKYEKVARTIYATLWEIAEMKTRLKVDKELPPEARTLPF